VNFVLNEKESLNLDMTAVINVVFINWVFN